MRLCSIGTVDGCVGAIARGDRIITLPELNAIGSSAPNRQEIDHTVLLRCRVFTDKTEQVLKEAGDLLIPINKGLYESENIIGEVADIITRKIKGRTSDSDVTLFKPVGIALEDMAVARAVYGLAARKGVGEQISF